MAYSINHIATLLQAQAILAQPQMAVEYLVTDSRRIVFAARSLFFALHTKRRNGNDFVGEVYNRGVRNFVVEPGFDASAYADANFIYAENTLLALQQLAANHRTQFSYPVIGITGSNGKTIVKEWLYQLLFSDYAIVRSPRSYNSQTGVPLSVWEMNNTHTLGIFEAGISEPGEMAALEKIIQPTIGVLTNIGEAHSEGFASNTQKLHEKLTLFAHCNTVIGREQDLQHLPDALLQHPELLTWGYSAGNQYIIRSITREKSSTTVNVSYQSKEQCFTIPFTDDASVENAITCYCVCLLLKKEAAVIAERIKNLQPVDMRLQLVQGINNCAVINDSYSFDVTSLSIALDFLQQQQQHNQKTVIISDLPNTSDGEMYSRISQMLSAKKITRVITIGQQWQQHQNLLKNTIAVTQHYNDTEGFIQQFAENHFRDEAILLKGARTFAFEKIAAILQRKVHQTLMEINLTAMAHNLKQYQQQLKPGVKLMAMVKAFGYGSGGAEVASLLQFHKVDYLAVAYADEGVELRKAGISLPIMVMNIDDAAFEALVQYDLEPELFSFNILMAFAAFVSKQGIKQYPVHIKIDTGMHRLGFEAHDMPALTALLAANRQLVIRSAFSHLAASEDPAEDAFTLQQANVFTTCCKQLEEAAGYSFIKHISNSAAIFRNHQLQFDMVRLGIGLYGVDSAVEHQLQLQTVASLKTTVAQLRTVKAGDTVGYNRRGKVTRDSLVATIRIGYADGFDRRMSNGNGFVFINGVEAPVIGSVAMDMTMVDVTGVPGVTEGGQVEIFGKNLGVQQVAHWCGTIAYEILTGISQRVKRVYLEE